MTYKTIPSFNNSDYKADIRDKVFNPLIEQHNKHSVQLENLENISNNVKELNELVDSADKIRNLVAHEHEIINLAFRSEDIMNIADCSGDLVGLDERVTILELKGTSHNPAPPPGGSYDDTAIKASIAAIEKNIDSVEGDVDNVEADVSDLTTRVEALELGGGGGSGGTVDLTPVLNRVSALETVVTEVEKDISALETTASDLVKEDTAIKASISDIEKEVDDHETRITDLENASPAPGGSSKPTKWFVLPMGGQSNCVGYGETSYDIKGFDAPNPRIYQLGRYNTVSDSQNISELTVNKVKCAYGTEFDKLRPDTDCNLKLIPATPCLDHIQNMFQHNKAGGGTVASGMYIARALLPYIPEDYGLLIVPSAFGGTGFTSGSHGTWNQAALRAENPRRHGADTPMGKDLFYRTKYALELNEENVLLPFIWVQGENDKDGSKGHYDGFKAFFEWFKNLFETENLHRFLPEKRMDNFRFFCLGPTKWWLGANTETDYIKFGGKNWETHEGSDVFDRVSTYNNYVFLSNLYKGATGKQLLFVRADIDDQGMFVETNREFGTGDTTSNRQIHFSTRGYSYNQADTMTNAILRHSGMFPGKGKLFSRPVWGGMGSVITDNVVNLQNVCSNYSKLSEGLVVHSDFSSGNASDNKVTSSAVVTAGSRASIVADPELGNVLNLVGSSGDEWVKYAISGGNHSYTKTITLKRDSSLQSASTAWVMPYSSGTTGGVIVSKNNGYLIVPDYTSSARTGSLMIHPSIEGNWNGGYDGWNHIALVYSKEFKKAMVFLNGNLVGSSNVSTAVLDGGVLGNTANGGTANLFKGKIANVRMYDRALSHEEIKALSEADLFSKI